MLHRGRDQYLPLHALQATARNLLLVVRVVRLGRHLTATIHHTGRLRRMDKSEGINHHDLSHLADHGGATELGPLLAAPSSHVRPESLA